jgi:TPR repeat protein
MFLLAALMFGDSAFAQAPSAPGAAPQKPLRERLLDRALQGDAEAQFDLGKNYEAGRIGLPKDFAKAEHWYRLAAEQGDPFAQASLAILLGFGKGIPKDEAQALMWYDIAVAGAKGGDRETIVEMRDDLARKMSPKDVAEAAERARAWKPKK